MSTATKVEPRAFDARSGGVRGAWESSPDLFLAMRAARERVPVPTTAEKYVVVGLGIDGEDDLHQVVSSEGRTALDAIDGAIKALKVVRTVLREQQVEA